MASFMSFIRQVFIRGKESPRSQITEIEQFYFRAMRELLNEHPDYPQVINDLQQILKIDPDYKNARHYLQRAQLLQQEDTPVRQGNGRQHNFNELQERLIDIDPAVRKAIIMELIQFGERAVDPLIALLMDDDADVRVHAATGLGWVGGSDALQSLLVALKDPDVQVRRHAARAICWVVEASAVPALIVALDDEDNYVRCYSARALGWSRDQRAVGPLKDLMDHDSVEVRDYAKTALDDLGHTVTT